MRVLLSHGCRFIFVDESSFSSRHLKFRSWVDKTHGWTVWKPFDSVSVASINALTDDGVLMTTLRQGINSWLEMTQFMLDVETYLRHIHGSKYLEL